MPKPQLYSRFSSLQNRDVEHFVRKSMKLMHFHPSDVIVDLGCGNGDATRAILLESIPKYSNIVGIDKCEEMLQYAKEQNAHPKLDYVHLDLRNKEQVSAKFHSHFHHAFSFHSLHWIDDQQQLFDNIFDMLKPGGDLLSLLVLQCEIKLVFQQVAKSHKWHQYISTGDEFVFPYHQSENPLKDLENIVEQAGFAHLIKTEQCAYTYKNADEFKRSMEAVAPMFKNVPSHRSDEFLNDLLHTFQDRLTHSYGSHTELKMPYCMAEMYLRKPYS